MKKLIRISCLVALLGLLFGSCKPTGPKEAVVGNAASKVYIATPRGRIFLLTFSYRD